MTTPSEGPETRVPVSDAMTRIGLDTPEKQAAFAEILEAHRQIVEREAALRQRTLGARAQRLAPYGLAAGAAAMTEPGQTALGAAGQWVGDTSVSAAQGISDLASAGWQNAVELKDAAGERWDSAVQSWNESSEKAGQQWDSLVHEAGQRWDSAVHGAGEAISTVSGWVTSGYHGLQDAGNAIGAWAGQQMDAVAANPTSHALVAGVAVGAVVAATPQLREAAGKAASAVNRWAKAGWSATTGAVRTAASATTGAVQTAASAVASVPGRTAEGVRNLMNEVRSDPRVQYVLHQAGLGPKETHAAANEANGITQGENTTLPSTPDVTKALGQDGAQPAAGTKVEQAQGTEAAATGTGQGEAAVTQQTTKKPDRGQGI